MIINENRLNLVDAKHRKYLMEQVEPVDLQTSATVPTRSRGYVPPVA